MSLLLASKSTKIIGPFDDANLTSHIIRMVPRNWQNQYKLSGAKVHQSVSKLLEAQEHIKKAFLTNKHHERAKSDTKTKQLYQGEDDIL
jgi:hypothetical protein